MCVGVPVGWGESRGVLLLLPDRFRSLAEQRASEWWFVI